MRHWSMTSWYWTAPQQERRTFWACFTGWALDSFDTQMFSFLIPALIATWSLSKADAGLLGTAALLSAAVGGWIAGVLADRFGRVRILFFTILWFTGFSLLAGFAQNFAQLLTLRTLQGFGFGGEWAVGATLLAEVVRPDHRGKAVGLVQSGFSIGWAFASVVAPCILALFPDTLAWRVALWFAVIPGALTLLLRRGLQESPLYLARKAASPEAGRADVLAVFRPDVVRATVLTGIVITGFQGASFCIINWLPTLLIQQRHMAPSQVVLTMLMLTGGAFVGYLANAYWSDRYGRRATLMAMSGAAGLITAVYSFAPLPWVLQAALGSAVGFTVNGMFASVGPFLSELFPTEIRTTCMAFSYNVGKSLGALSVVLVGALSERMALDAAIGIFCLLGYAVALAALTTLPETRGRNLDRLEVTGRPMPAGSPAHAEDGGTRASSLRGGG